MLLPSDVARLVLGYLQEEGLSATSQAFIHESPNLKEYADHTTGDGTIPACVFSLFGKGLTTILNEYVAIKTKESSHEVPAVMTSLWKKLDFTLNQIKSLQNSPSISTSQRVRSRIGVANMARQRALALVPACGVISSSLSETSAIISPAHTSFSAPSHSTPLCYTGPHTRAAPGTLTTPRDTPVQIVVSEQRLNPGPMSPARRKWDTPRKRSGVQTGSSGPGRSAAATSGPSTEPQPEEVIDENFPQLVIQNARDKILGDRSLQEKLAENINKILANEPPPQTTKTPSCTVEADQSIDDFLGLQDEIHMSDDAIHDILEQTESDPAFQALFELFDCNKNKFADGDGDVNSCAEENNTAGPSSAVKPVESGDSGATQADTNAPENTQKMKAGQERKNRKPSAPTLVKKIVICSSGRSSRIENSSARLIVNPVDVRGVSSAPVDSSNKEKASLLSDSASVAPMDIDEPLHTPPLPCMTVEEATKFTTTTTPVNESASAASSRVSAEFAAPMETSASNTGQKQDHLHAQGSKEQPATAFSSALDSQHVFLSPAQVELINNSPAQTAYLPQSASTSEASTATPVSSSSPVSATPGSPTSVSTSSILTATSTSSTPASTPSSDPPVPTPSADPSSTNKAAAVDSSSIMSLKIIISDNQEEEAAADTALSSAISSISVDKMPTIYLSSPVKSSACPATPKGSCLDEAAQAVSGLQNSEVHASPVSSKAGAFIASPLTGTSQGQQNYIIQLPLDPANSALQGTTASYILVTEPPTTDVQGTQVLLPAGVSKGHSLHTNQYGAATSPHAQGFSPGSALILPSPVKPMMLPVSVVGQNTLGNIQMLSNQVVAIPNPLAVQQQTETVKPKPPTVASKQPATSGGEKNPVRKGSQPVSAENTDQQEAAKGANHRRILCFDGTTVAEPQAANATNTTTSATPNTTTSQSVQQPEKDNKQPVPRAKPAILGGNRPKRRVETVRCSADPIPGGGLMKESNLLQQHQKDPVKRTSRKQEHNIQRQESENVDTSQPETRKKSEKRSKSSDRKHSRDTSNHETKSRLPQSSRSSSSDSTLRSGSRKDKEESRRKETAEKASLKSREGRTEKRTPSQAMPNVTANKENEIKDGKKEPKTQSTPSSSTSREFSPPAGTQPTPNTQSKGTKTPSKTSSLAKQAAEMLQDIQGLNSPSTVLKKPGASISDLSPEVATDCLGTPPRQKKGKDAEGTPKRLMPPNTQDVPTCSPASEAGSESSINMAAHTLMILSRAAISRTGTPLKDSLRQEGVEEKSPASSKNPKKRKQTSPSASPPAKKESKQSPSKKKDREKKKLIDCFPHDLDVDKFLSSLHYDE